MIASLAFGLAAAGAVQADQPESTPEARVALDAFSQCIADRSPDFAAQTLDEDFRSNTYENRLRHVTRVNEDCFRGSGGRNRMRSGGLLIAGGMAERLLERNPAAVNVQLAHAASRPAPSGRTPAEGVALCVVRSTPDDVARLFSTDVASEAETPALRTLQPVVSLCNQSGPALQVSDAGLRAILATAAFRTVRTDAPTREARN